MYFQLTRLLGIISIVFAYSLFFRSWVLLSGILCFDWSLVFYWKPFQLVYVF